MGGLGRIQSEAVGPGIGQTQGDLAGNFYLYIRPGTRLSAAAWSRTLVTSCGAWFLRIWPKGTTRVKSVFEQTDITSHGRKWNRRP